MERQGAVEAAAEGGNLPPHLYQDRSRALYNGLRTHFNNNAYSDIVVVAPSGSRMFCHQVVLVAGSRKFATVLEGGEAAGKELPVQGVDSAALEAVLVFFYSGECILTVSNVVALYDVCLKLEVAGLTAACEAFLEQTLAPGTCAVYLEAAVKLLLEDVVKKCLTYAKRRFDDIAAAPGFSSISIEAMRLLLTHCRSSVGDMTLARALARWTMQRPEHVADAESLFKDLNITASVLLQLLSSQDFQQSQQHGAGAPGGEREHEREPGPGARMSGAGPSGQQQQQGKLSAAQLSDVGGKAGGGSGGRQLLSMQQQQQQQQQQLGLSGGNALMAAQLAGLQQQGLGLQVLPSGAVSLATNQLQQPPLKVRLVGESPSGLGEGAQLGSWQGVGGLSSRGGLGGGGGAKLQQRGSGALPQGLSSHYLSGVGGAAERSPGGSRGMPPPSTQGSMGSKRSRPSLDSMRDSEHDVGPTGTDNSGSDPSGGDGGGLGLGLGHPTGLPPVLGGGGGGGKVLQTCHVDNCNFDLSGLKEYHQRFRICDYHLKASTVLRDGIPQRFCQQCGRFHLLSEFDGNKRSCRARLQRHNARRRKRLEDRQQAALVAEGLPGDFLGEQLQLQRAMMGRSSQSANFQLAAKLAGSGSAALPHRALAAVAAEYEQDPSGAFKGRLQQQLMQQQQQASPKQQHHKQPGNGGAPADSRSEGGASADTRTESQGGEQEQHDDIGSA